MKTEPEASRNRQPKTEAARATPDLDLPLVLDLGGAGAQYRQLAAQLRGAILEDRLASGARLPPSRVLAGALGVNRNVVVAAFELLVAEGLLVSRQRHGSFVARPALAEPVTTAPLSDATPASPQLDGQEVDCRLGATAVSPLPLAVWRRAWRTAARTLPHGDYGPPEGEWVLRQAIADYLRRVRTLRVSPGAVVVTAGATAALQALYSSVVEPGSLAILEEPGYPLAREYAGAAGAVTRPAPVDDEGLVVAGLPAAPPDGRAMTLHVTPSHQYPLGGAMSVPRRHALLEWARRTGALIVENDYDSEYRFGAPLLPALAALEPVPAQVAYVGTFSRVLTPSLRVGFVVAPPGVRERLVAFLERRRERVPQPVQQAVAELIVSGDLERHLRRSRRFHARRREALLGALAELPAAASLRRQGGGLHLSIELGSPELAAAVAAAARRRGISIETFAPYYSGPATRFGVLIGFGAHSPGVLEAVGRALVASLQEALALSPSPPSFSTSSPPPPQAD